MTEKRYYTKKEVAAMLGVNPRTVERYLLAGKIQGARLERAWRISEEDIQAFYDKAKADTVKALKERKK